MSLFLLRVSASLTVHSLQRNTVVHWTTWLGGNVLLGILGFVIGAWKSIQCLRHMLTLPLMLSLAEAVPILNYLLGLAAALCFAPFSLIFPALLW